MLTLPRCSSWRECVLTQLEPQKQLSKPYHVSGDSCAIFFVSLQFVNISTCQVVKLKQKLQVTIINRGNKDLHYSDLDLWEEKKENKR